MEGTFKDLGGGRSIFYGWGEAMHTRLDVILCHRPAAECEAAAGRILLEIKRLETRLSKFDPASDLARVNAGAADRPVAVDDEMWDILASALRYGAMTAWWFDIGYASKRGNPEGRVCLDPQRRAVMFRSRGTELDLGGFGKGYALQKVREMLEGERWTDFLLNFGNSSVCARGDRPGARGWTVGVENLSRPGSNALEITLRDESLNTSGNTARHTRHIYSPERAEFLVGTRSVSVVTSGPLEGEVLSTALFAAEPAERPAILRKFAAARAYQVDYSGGTHTVRVL